MSKYNLQRYKTSLVLDFAADDNEITASAILNGLLRGVILTVPDLDSSDTTTINIKDADGNVLYTKGTLAESTTHKLYDMVASDASTIIPMAVPLAGPSITIDIVTSGAQTANRTFGVILLVDRG